MSEQRPTLDEIMVAYGSDKSSAPSEPWMWGQSYTTRIYEDLFAPLRDEPITLLELGWGEYDPVRRDHSSPDNGGRSARGWHDYFPKADIIAVELAAKNFPDAASYPRISLYDRTDQTDAHSLGGIRDKHGPFHIVIDDASHVSSLTIRSFEIIWPMLAKGGIYVVEDLHSSYHDYYFGTAEANRDPSHDENTAMGFFKRLTDDTFYTGARPKGPAVDGDPCSWDCYPRRYWQGYDIESITFAAPQAIVIRKRS